MTNLIKFSGDQTFESSGLITYNPSKNSFKYVFTIPLEEKPSFEGIAATEYFILGAVKFKVASSQYDLFGAEYVANGELT